MNLRQMTGLLSGPKVLLVHVGPGFFTWIRQSGHPPQIEAASKLLLEFVFIKTDGFTDAAQRR